MKNQDEKEEEINALKYIQSDMIKNNYFTSTISNRSD